MRRVTLQNGQRGLARGAPADRIHVLFHLMRHDGLVDVADVPQINEVVDETGQKATVGGDRQAVDGSGAACVHDRSAF